MAKLETAFEKRCGDCLNLKNVNGEWCCEECFNQKVNDIDECPLGITVELLEELNEKGSEARKQLLKAESEPKEKKEKKVRERKPDPDKELLISNMADFLKKIAENVEITNISKIIEFDLNENHYKIDLIRQRNKKK